MKEFYLKCVNSLRHMFSFQKKEHYQDPEFVYSANIVTHHSPLRLLEDASQAFASVKKHRASTPTKWIQFIARVDDPSTCLFKLYANPQSIPRGLLTATSTTSDFDSFSEMGIPSNWQMIIPHQDPPIYTNLKYPWKRSTMWSTAVPKKDNPTGVYHITFSIDQLWLTNIQSRNVFLTLHGAGAGVDVYVNGNHIGYGQDSMTETEFDISSADLKLKDNILQLVCYRWTDGSYLEDQDQWFLAGVFRDIELSCRPSKDGILDYFVVADPESRTVTVDLELTNPDTQVQLSLYDATEQLVAQSSTTTLSLDAAPNLWDVQNPYLYTLVLETSNQIEATRVGFRKVCIKNAQVHINDSPILVCGVNRHEFDQHRGKSISEELMLKDILLLKKFNFNAVRNSHYPNTHRWYELCDEYGLYIIDEANVECHGMVPNISLLQNDSKWKNAFLTRAKAMVLRSRNRPCIIGWSLGNESGCGANMRACATWIREVDSTRTLQYEGGGYNGDSPMLLGDGRDPFCTDIICPMYDSPKRLVEVNNETTAKGGRYRERPLILCEYAHAMGNSNGNLHQYWYLFKSTKFPKIQGGFIWDWCDQGILHPDFLEGKSWGYGGDFGETSGKEDTTFCINGMVLPDRSLKPGMFEAKYLMQPLTLTLEESTMTVSVEFFPHATRDLAFSFELYNFSDAKPVKSEEVSLANGGELKIPLQTQDLDDHTLVVNAHLSLDKPYAKAGHLVATERFCLDSNNLRVPPTSPPSDVSSVSTRTDDNSNLEITAKNYTAVFDVANGSLVSFCSSDKEELIHSLGHSFFRAPTDNDVGGLDTMLPYEFLKKFIRQSETSLCAQWRKLHLHQLVRKVTRVNVVESTVDVVEEYRTPKGSLRFTVETKYKFQDDGLVLDVVVISASKVRTIMTLPRIGLELQMPGHFTKTTFLGRGPHECYPDRKAGARFGVHDQTVDDFYTPYVLPTESGGRSDVHWAVLKSEQTGQELRIEYSCDDGPSTEEVIDASIREKGPFPRPAGSHGAQFNCSRYSTQEVTSARHPCELPEVVEDKTPLYVNIDTAFAGLGGDVSWMPKLHPQYRVMAKTWTYSVRFTV